MDCQKNPRSVLTNSPSKRALPRLEDIYGTGKITGDVVPPILPILGKGVEKGISTLSLFVFRYLTPEIYEKRYLTINTYLYSQAFHGEYLSVTGTKPLSSCYL